MTNSNQILLGPTEKISEELINQISEMNEGKPEFQTYKRRIRNVFHLKEHVINEKICYFLAGFIEGEGSISMSIKKNPNAKFGIELDPLFNLTQHVNGVNHLYLALVMFQTGRIRYKSGSNATLVLIIEPRKSLQEKVCPYFEKYIYPLSSPAKQIRYKSFKKMLDLFDQKAHLDKDRFIYEMLPIWDSMRVQINNKSQTFRSLEEAQKYAANFEK